MTWLFFAAGAVVTASLLPHTRDKVKDVPWLAVAVAVGLGVMADSIKSIGTDTADSIKSIGTDSMQHCCSCIE